MRRVLTMLGNLFINTLAAITSFTAEELRHNARLHYEEAMQTAREAAAAKRQELEQELAERSNGQAS